MSFDPKDIDGVGKTLQRKLTEAIGVGQLDSIRTVIRNTDDSTIMMRTRGGRPEITMERKQSSADIALKPKWPCTFVFRSLQLPRPSVATIANSSGQSFEILSSNMPVYGNTVSYNVINRSTNVQGYARRRFFDVGRLSSGAASGSFVVNGGAVQGMSLSELFPMSGMSQGVLPAVIAGSAYNLELDGGYPRSSIAVSFNNSGLMSVGFLSSVDGELVGSSSIPITDADPGYFAGTYFDSSKFFFCAGKVGTGMSTVSGIVNHSYVRKCVYKHVVAELVSVAPFVSVGIEITDVDRSAAGSEIFEGDDDYPITLTIPDAQIGASYIDQARPPEAPDGTILLAGVPDYPRTVSCDYSASIVYYAGTSFESTSTFTASGSHEAEFSSGLWIHQTGDSVDWSFDGNRFVDHGGQWHEEIKSAINSTSMVLDRQTKSSSYIPIGGFRGDWTVNNANYSSHDMAYIESTAITFESKDFIFFDPVEEVYVYLETILSFSRYDSVPLDTVSNIPTQSSVLIRYVVDFRGTKTNVEIYSGGVPNSTSRYVGVISAGGPTFDYGFPEEYTYQLGQIGNGTPSGMYRISLPPQLVNAPFTSQGNCPYIAFTTKQEESNGAIPQIYVDMNVKPIRPYPAPDDSRITRHNGTIEFVPLRLNHVVFMMTPYDNTNWPDGSSPWATFVGTNPTRIQVMNNVSGPWQSKLGSGFIDGSQVEITRV